ncbi:MAG: MBL fold metallo-hydrolase [Hyphomicrobiales bacterium]|nr:MBL fold metallo-hydrolase [Hyphomicrobiales bacterium]
MTLRLTILGCGTSAGTPRIGGHWGACDPDNPKNRRRRASLLVQRFAPEGETAVLVDTSPDLRQQLLGVDVGWVDGVLYSHDHADHTHGIDDLRFVGFNGRRRVDIYGDTRTLATLKQRFGYCFETPPGSSYPPILDDHLIAPGRPVRIEGAGGAIEAMPYLQHHGEIDALGFRFGNVAYSCDIKGLPEESYDYLKDLDVWIVDALRYTSHPSHFSLEESLAAIERVKPKRAVLTHMHVDLDYETLRRELPEGVEPAYDGMVLETAD